MRAAPVGPRPRPLAASSRFAFLAWLAAALLGGVLSASGMFVQEQEKAHNGAFGTALSQGREFDSHAGHYFFRNRSYFPEWGSFATPDMNMARGPLGEPMGMGSSGAFANNPLGKRDPTGKAWLPPEQLLPYREIPGAVKRYAESERFDLNGDGVVDAKDEEDFLLNPSAGFESGDPSTAFMALDRVIRDPVQAEEHTKTIQDARDWLANPDNARYLAQRNEGLYQSAVALSLFSVRSPFTPRTGALPGTWLARSRLVMGAGDPGLGFMTTRLAAEMGGQPLFRAVTDPELHSIQNLNRFSTLPGSSTPIPGVQGKWFYSNLEDAQRWAGQAAARDGGPLHIIRTSVPESVSPAWSQPWVDGIPNPALFHRLENLNGPITVIPPRIP